MTDKLKLNYVKSEFEKDNYILLSEKYINNKQKLRYICPQGHTHNISWNSWVGGRRCSICARNQRLSLRFVKTEFNKENYVVLSNEYTNSNMKIECICSMGHKYAITWADWSKGRRCNVCKGVEQSIRQMGKDNPAWRGGVWHDLYCPLWHDKDYKESIRERDGHKCLNPYCSNKIDRLNIHHIDYDKENCQPLNLITLCASCNGKANFDRKWHTAWYNAIIYRRYKVKEN